MKGIGLDIGTTTICAVVLDGDTGKILESKTVTNDTSLKSNDAYENIQDANLILYKVTTMLQQLIKTHGHIDSIGVTGQMHGILYVNKEGNAISPLYTWQDGRGDILYVKEETYAQYLTKITGYQMSTGFGLTTHFYNLHNDLVPENASSICTIGDYISMKIGNGRIPVISPSNAASLGCFKLQDTMFDLEALEKMNINCDILPIIKQGYELAGKTMEGIPVSVAIGDNQGSVLGSVQDMQNTVLVNVGTGSQVSIGVADCLNKQLCTDIELRPFVDKDFILVGSSLCGGRAYAMLEIFFREVVTLVSGSACISLYDVMDKAILKEKISEPPLIISTRFSGTRANPKERGSINNIDIHNFTPVNMMVGMLQGIARELFELYYSMCKVKETKATVLIGSGNGIRRNKHLQKILEEIFQLKLRIPMYEEEAAYGAVLFSLVASGNVKNINEAQKVIQYI